MASPMIPFRILGLLLWGATKETWITRCQVRHCLQITASTDPIPALFFASALSFDELCRRLCQSDGSPLPYGRGKEPSDFLEGWLREHPRVAEHQLLQLQTLSIGDQVQIELEGPFYQLVFWGLGAEG